MIKKRKSTKNCTHRGQVTHTSRERGKRKRKRTVIAFITSSSSSCIFPSFSSNCARIYDGEGEEGGQSTMNKLSSLVYSMYAYNWV